MTAHRTNPADLLRTYSVAELERIAEEYHGKSGDGFYIPVDIDLLVEKREDVDLDIWPGMQANHKLLGMVGINPQEEKKIRIYIDADLADRAEMRNRYRMTIAEELAHVLLHRPAIESVAHPDDFKFIQTHPQWYEYERNAKRLAAALLMPAQYLIEDARKLYTEIIHKLPVQYKYTNASAVQKTIVAALAKRYEVSFQSMEYRLNEWPIQVLRKIDEAMKNQMSFLD
jgi:hypothetical protein